MSASTEESPQPASEVLPQYLYTERMVLDRYDHSDQHVEESLTLFNTNALRKAMGKGVGPRTREQAEALYMSCRINTTTRSGKRLNIDEPLKYMCRLGGKTGTFIGAVSLGQRAKSSPPDIGWAFMPDYHGKGYALEASKELFRFITEDLDLSDIIVWPSVDNTPSRRLAEKLGFLYSGTVESPEKIEKALYLMPNMKLDGELKLSIWGEHAPGQ